MNRSFITGFGVSVAVLLPHIASAQGTTLENIFTQILGLINIVAGLIVALAVVYFLWGVAKYVGSQGDASAREEARNTMIWGIIAIFVMVSVWGLVNLLRDTFNLEEGETFTPPTVEDLDS